MAAHEPIEFYSISTLVLERAGFSETLVKHIAQAYRILYKANTSQHDALIRIREQIPNSPEIENIIKFVESSKLGIIHRFVSLVEISIKTSKARKELWKFFYLVRVWRMSKICYLCAVFLV